MSKGIYTAPGPVDLVHEWAYLPDFAVGFVALARNLDKLGFYEALNFPGHAVTDLRDQGRGREGARPAAQDDLDALVGAARRQPVRGDVARDRLDVLSALRTAPAGLRRGWKASSAKSRIRRWIRRSPRRSRISASPPSNGTVESRLTARRDRHAAHGLHGARADRAGSEPPINSNTRSTTSTTPTMPDGP